MSYCCKGFDYCFYFLFSWQTLQGVSASEFKTNYDVNNMPFIYTVADTMTGLTPSNVFVVSVTDGMNDDEVDVDSRRRRLERTMHGKIHGQFSNIRGHSVVDDTEVQIPLNKHKLEANTEVPPLVTHFKTLSDDASQPPSCNVSYYVLFNTFGAGYSSAYDAFNTMTAELENAVSSGAFTNHLHYYAAIFHADNLTSVNATNVYIDSTYTTIIPTIESDDSTPVDNSAPIIAGVTIALIVLMVSVLCCIRRVMMDPNKKTRSGLTTPLTRRPREEIMTPTVVSANAIYAQESVTTVSAIQL
jgi:hypothetical protein